MGIKDFWGGFGADPAAKYQPRSMSQQVDYEMGQRARGGQPGGFHPGGGSLADAAGFFKGSLWTGVIGAVGGFGYGLWQLFTDAASPGLGADALTVLKWTGIGAGGGALVPAALIAGASAALLFGIFWALGLLLNFLSGL